MQTQTPATIDLATAYGGMQHAGHRRPYHAGGADRYYGRPYLPNFAFNGTTYSADEMTPDQRAEYADGFWGETSRKVWSDPAPVEVEA